MRAWTEMRQSLSIIEQLIDNIPDGEFQAKTKAVLKLPKGEFYSRVETRQSLSCRRLHRPYSNEHLVIRIKVVEFVLPQLL